MLLKERVNENACGNISELASQERMRDVNTFFFWRRIRSVDRIALQPVVEGGESK